MSKTDRTAIAWLDDVEDHDFDAAGRYLSLRFDERTAKGMVDRLRHAEVTARRANDILRACSRSALPLDDPGVLRDLVKVASGKKLSPVLVISFPDGVDIADGYHRVSLVYQLDPFADLPLRIASVDRDLWKG